MCLLVVQQFGYPSRGPPRISVDGENRYSYALHIGFWRVSARVQLYAYRIAWLARAARLRKLPLLFPGLGLLPTYRLTVGVGANAAL